MAAWPLLVEGHHDHGGAVAPDELARVLEELRLAFLERDGVHDAFALQALQAGLDDLHFDESTMNGTFAISGSAADADCRKRVIAATPSIIPSSM